EMSQIVWEAATNVLKRDLSGYGVAPTDRVSPIAGTPLAELFGGAARLLGLPKAAMFARDSEAGAVRVAATIPAAVIVCDSALAGTADGRFRIGCALVGTRSPYVIPLTRSVADAQKILNAIAVGFGPAGSQEDATAVTARLAQELMTTLPPRGQ